jgi:long-chain acyl-CoA synthetase
VRDISGIETLRDLFERGCDPPQALHCGWRTKEGRVEGWSTAELRDRVESLGRELVARGMRTGDSAAIVSRNSSRWLATDFAMLRAGLVVVPVYPTLALDQVRHVLDDSGSRGLFVEDARQLERILPALEGTRLEWISILSDETVEHPLAVSWSAMVESGRANGASLTPPKPSDLASIIYTSGTTARSKGVELTHANLVSNALQADGAVELSKQDVRHVNLSLLPVSHIFQRLVDYLLFLCGAQMIACPDPQEAVPYFHDVRPTFFSAVPRIWEKVHATMIQRMAQQSAWRRAMGEWGLRVGRRHFQAWYADGACDGQPGALLSAQHAIADALVLRKLRSAFGGNVDICFSGGGPLTKDLHEFYRAIGLNLLPGYGLTETSPVLTTNRRRLMRLGTVGPALPGVELRVEPDGELLARGANVMRGYHNLPEDTAATITPDGWLLTGDLARIDERGFVTITGRKKEILVLTTGKKVVPLAVEERIARSRFVAQSVLVGDEEKFVAALIWPHVETLRTAALAKGLDVKSLAAAELLARADVKRIVQADVDACCKDLADFERPKTIAFLTRELTLADDELTPSLKVKRRIVARNWKPAIDECFGRTP